MFGASIHYKGKREYNKTAPKTHKRYIINEMVVIIYKEGYVFGASIHYKGKREYHKTAPKTHFPL